MLHCQQEGKEFTLTFEDYISLVVAAGLSHPKQIGRKIGDFNLARYGDIGGYSKESCRFIPKKENLEERITNGRMEVAANKTKAKWYPNKIKLLCMDRHSEHCFVCCGYVEAAEILNMHASNICQSVKKGSFQHAKYIVVQITHDCYENFLSSNPL